MAKVPKLTERIRFFKPVSGRDTAGAVRPTKFKHWRMFFAAVNYKSGSRGDRVEAGQTVNKVQAVFTVRSGGYCNCGKIKPNMRIQYDGYWWAIESVIPSNDNAHYSDVTAVRGGYTNKPYSQRPIL